MVEFLVKLLLVARSRLKSRARLEAENLVLRQQVIVLSRKTSRVWLRNIDPLIFVRLYRLFPTILNAITVVKPETAIRWHQRGLSGLLALEVSPRWWPPQNRPPRSAISSDG